MATVEKSVEEKGLFPFNPAEVVLGFILFILGLCVFLFSPFPFNCCGIVIAFAGILVVIF